MLDVANPFATASDLPHGLPPFDRIEPAHLMPAIRAGLAAQREEWDAIATDPTRPTVANTLHALERSGGLLDRALTVHHSLASSVIDDEVRARDEELAPLLAEHRDALLLDGRILARLEALRDAAGTDAADPALADPETARLLERIHTDFVRAGAALPEEGRERLRALNQALSSATTRFSALLVQGTSAAAVHVTDRARLDGLDDGELAAAAQAAQARGLDGWLLTHVLFSTHPLLASLHDRGMREELHRASVGRCLDGPHDTRATVVEIVRLRAERAQLLGHETHAHHVIADQTAGDVETVMATLAGMVGPAVANAHAEAEAMTAMLHADGHEGPLQPWDWPLYAERVRRRDHGVDQAALRPWFAFERVMVDGVLAAAERLYGVTFHPRDELPTYHPDIRTWEVRDADGSDLGLVLVDPWARDSKRGGAWMTTLSDQSHLLGARPVVTVTLNIPAPPPSEEALLTIDEVDTAFHEFGHALHGLFSDVTYPRFSGTAVPRDFVEFPSQVNEMWAFDPDILAGYARHHRTGEPLAAEAVAALVAARQHRQGFATTEYLGATLLDLAWHRLTPEEVPDAADVEAFEAAALEAAGVAVPFQPPRYRSSYFSHIFGGGPIGYSAGYYSYIWAEVLDAELVQWFGEQGGLRRENGDVFRQRLLSRGGAVDPIEAFESVRGRPATLEPLLARRGLTTT